MVGDDAGTGQSASGWVGVPELFLDCRSALKLADGCMYLHLRYPRFRTALIAAIQHNAGRSYIDTPTTRIWRVESARVGADGFGYNASYGYIR